MPHWKFYALMTLVCIVIQAFFTMLEMACVSFNKVRLQYYVSIGHKRALWLSHLLKKPGLLFGTTLIGVNTALTFGSEFSRRFYESMGLNPDIAPFTQIFLVLIFAELSPLFAARRYSEHVAMLGVPIIYAFSIILRPVIKLFDLICIGVNKLIGSEGRVGPSLSRDELQKALEEKEEAPSDEFDTITSNIFSLRAKSARDLMEPLTDIQMVPATFTVGAMRTLLTTTRAHFLPIYQKGREHIIGIAFPRDLLRLSDQKSVRDHCRPPWFITEHEPVFQILKQFRRNNQSLAVVLDGHGLAKGILTLDNMIDEIFKRAPTWTASESHPSIILDRSFAGETLLSDLNEEFGLELSDGSSETLTELINHHLGHAPTKGEHLRINNIDFIIDEASLLGARLVTLRTN